LSESVPEQTEGEVYSSHVAWYVCFGAVYLSEIGRCLGETISYKKTTERLCRHLGQSGLADEITDVEGGQSGIPGSIHTGVQFIPEFIIFHIHPRGSADFVRNIVSLIVEELAGFV